jgi:hypothetical protein
MEGLEPCKKDVAKYKRRQRHGEFATAQFGYYPCKMIKGVINLHGI